MQEEQKSSANNFLTLINVVVVVTLIALVYAALNKFAYVTNYEPYQKTYFYHTIAEYIPLKGTALYFALCATAISSVVCATTENTALRYVTLTISTIVMLFIVISLFGCVEHAQSICKSIEAHESVPNGVSFQISGWSIYVIAASLIVTGDNLFFAIVKAIKPKQN